MTIFYYEGGTNITDHCGVTRAEFERLAADFLALYSDLSRIEAREATFDFGAASRGAADHLSNYAVDNFSNDCLEYLGGIPGFDAPSEAEESAANAELAAAIETWTRHFYRPWESALTYTGRRLVVYRDGRSEIIDAGGQAVSE